MLKKRIRLTMALILVLLTFGACGDKGVKDEEVSIGMVDEEIDEDHNDNVLEDDSTKEDVTTGDVTTGDETDGLTNGVQETLEDSLTEDTSILAQDNSDSKLDSSDEEAIKKQDIANNQEASKDTSKDTSKETSKDTSKEASKDTSKDTSKETSKDTSKETSKETSKDTSKDASKEASKDTSKETSKDTSKDTSKETSKDTGKETSKDTSKESNKETNKDKDTGKSDAMESVLANSLSDIVTQIYELKSPGIMTFNNPLDLSNADAVKYNTGLKDTSKVKEAIVSEAMMISQAYSLVLVRVNNPKDTESVAKEMLEGIDPAKWICVSADDLQIVTMEEVILLIMVSSQLSDTVTSQEIVDAFAQISGKEFGVELSK